MVNSKYAQLLKESGLSEDSDLSHSHKAGFFNEITPSNSNKLTSNGSCNSGCNNGTCHQEGEEEFNTLTL